jgi:ribose transport system substrate-binding protein
MTHVRLAAAVVALSAIVGIAGCGGSSSTTGASAKLKVVYVPGLTGNPFYSTVGCGAMSVASTLNVDFSVQGAPQWDVAKQTSIVNAIVTTKPAAIMISINDPKGSIAPLAAAKAAGIKVVTIDGDLQDTSIAVTNIQSDNLKGGQLAGEKMGALMGGQGTVAIIDNDPGFPISEQRVQGFETALKAFPGIKSLGVQYSHNDTSKAAGIVSASITSHADLKGVYTVETNNTEGAITGVRESGKTGQVSIVGYDTSDPIVAALHAGTLAADVVQYPYGEGKLGLQSAVDAVHGKSVPRNQSQPFVIATQQNVDTAEVQQYIYKINC